MPYIIFTTQSVNEVNFENRHAKTYNVKARNNAFGKPEAGLSQTSEARQFNVAQSAISRHCEHGTNRSYPRPGRPSIATTVQGRYIRVLHIQNRTLTGGHTATQIPVFGAIYGQTVRNRL